MKIALIYPNYLDNFFLISASFYPPLGIAMIASVLKNAGHEVHVIEATAERMNIHQVTKRIKEIKPDLIGITTNIAIANKALLTGQWLKRRVKGIPILFGGPWATVEYQKVFSSGAGDYVVRGEGEETVVELVDAIENSGPLKDVKGIVYRCEGGSIVCTDARPHIENLDELPFPAWELFPKHKKYFWNPKGKKFYPLMTSRGCPLDCIHCTKLVHGYKYRTRSIDHVIKEIKYLRENFGMDEIIIIDDNFNFNIERAEKICDEIMKINFKIHLRFTNGLRADRLTPRLSWKLKKAGAYDIVLGIESGNQDVVYGIGKRLDLNKVRRAVRILRKVGIFTSGFFMIGLPNETISTMIDTKRFILELDLDRTFIFKVIPFPGTKLYEIVKEKGTFLEAFEKNLVFYSNQSATFEIEGLPHELVELAFQDLYKSAYLKVRKILNMMTKIRLKNWRIHLNFAISVILRSLNRKNRLKLRNMKKKIIEKLRTNI